MALRVEKHAILINGDVHSHLSEEHAKNVQVLNDFLNREGYAVLELKGEGANQKRLSQLIDGLRKKMDGDDELFVYVTGHGDSVEGEEMAVVEDQASLPLRWIDAETKKLNYKERVVWVDGCFSGGSLRYFSEDPKTLFVSAGSKEEEVACYHFTQPAFQNGEDLNKDGVVTFGERFVAGANNVRSKNAGFQPIYFAGRDYEDNGTSLKGIKGRFGAEVVDVEDAGDLERELSRLQPGEYAIVDFSAEWCGPCKTYAPQFEKMARENGGRYLWIRAEGKDEDWKRYRITGFPQVKIFREGDPLGFEVIHRENPVGEVSVSLLDKSLRTAHLLDYALKQMASSDILERYKGSGRVTKLLDEGKMNLTKVRELWEENPQARAGLGMALGNAYRLGDVDERARFFIMALDSDSNPDVRVQAAVGLEKIGPLWNMGTKSPEPFVEEAKRVLIKALDDVDSGVRRTAVSSLWVYGRDAAHEALPKLLERFVDPDGEVRAEVIEAVSMIEFKNPSFPTLFQAALKDSYFMVRRNAVTALKNRREDAKEAIPQIREMLQDPVDEVRFAAAVALARIEDKYSPAISILREGLKGPNYDDRWDAIYALGKMGEIAKEAVPDLIEKILHRPEDSWVIVNILNAIIAIDPSRASAHLKAILISSDDNLVDVLVIKKAGTLGDAGVLLLADFLGGPSLEEKQIRWARRWGNEFVQWMRRSFAEDIAAQLKELGPRAIKAVPALREAIQKERNDDVRKALQEALDSIESRQK